MCLVHVCKLWYLRTFNILDSKTIAHCRSVISVQFRARFSSVTGASNARIDGMSVISLTYSICPVYKIWDLRTFNFLDSKAIAHCRSAISVQFRAS